MLNKLAFSFYKLLLVLAGVAMVGAFVSILLNILTRIFLWNIPGLDGYAGYCIAATLFLALPATLQSNEHIRATLLLERVSSGVRGVFELVSLLLGSGIALFLAWFAMRLVWMSYTLHDVAYTGDATPLWIPQLSMALGCFGFAVAFSHALVAKLAKTSFYSEPASKAAHVD